MKPPTDVGAFFISWGIAPTLVGSVPTSRGILPTSREMSPTLVGSVPTSRGRSPTLVGNIPTDDFIFFTPYKNLKNSFCQLIKRMFIIFSAFSQKTFIFAHRIDLLIWEKL